MIYRYVLDCDVAESFLRLSNRQREDLIRIFRTLADDPHVKGEQVFRDNSFREIQKRQYGRWLVTFWTDHPVKEVRILGVQQAAR